jgi:5-hydroxyisourate hydrolase
VAGVYRLVFDTGRYFASLGVITLYPSIVVVFEAQPGESHYHVPLLLSPFGYSTYRGS